MQLRSSFLKLSRMKALKLKS